MWESATAPSGWKLCDGTNGTPNLEDHFIESVTNGDENTISTGDNTVNVLISRSTTHSATHSHASGSANSETLVYPAGSYAWSHSHTISADEDLSFLPSYYALTFIMKT